MREVKYKTMKAFLMAMPQEMFANSLFTILESKYKGLNIQTATNMGEMAALLKRETYDLAIVQSGTAAMDFSKKIMAAGISMPVLVYTDTDHTPFVKQLYGLGVLGVLNVNDNEKEILKAVDDVLAKRIYMSEKLKNDLLQDALFSEEFANHSDINSRKNIFPQKQSCLSKLEENMPITFINDRITLFSLCLN